MDERERLRLAELLRAQRFEAFAQQTIAIQREAMERAERLLADNLRGRRREPLLFDI